MNRFLLLTSAFIYYIIWLLLPVFELDGKTALFPLPSAYAVYLPIMLLIIGFTLIGTFLGSLLLFNNEIELVTKS
ncbi:hypothetical protein ZYGR_0I04600 [Zygosaccharomyces rouxii]|nr:hypothetical protein ZYGR_0I04600 [Zygosaccharomyces rouxii]